MRIIPAIFRLILHYVIGVLFAFGLGMWGVWCICYVVLVLILDLYADFAAYLMYLSFFFFGIPLGGTLGMLLVDRFIIKRHLKYLRTIGAGFLMGILGSAFVYWVLPLYGIDWDTWLPPIRGSYITGGIESFFLITTFFSLIGYHSVGLFEYIIKAQKIRLP